MQVEVRIELQGCLNWVETAHQAIKMFWTLVGLSSDTYDWVRRANANLHVFFQTRGRGLLK
jgi:hypothetical protein